MRTEHRFFIGGKWVEPHNGAAMEEIVNPATEEVIATVAVPGPKDAAAAIEAARKAFDEGPWPHLSPAERAAGLRRMHEALRARRRDIIELMIDAVGSTVLIAKSFQGSWPIEFFAMVADWVEGFEWEREVPTRTEPMVSHSTLVHEPVGVVSAITPFNYPFFVNALKVAPAIGMGNTIVLKTSPWTPLDSFEIARAAEEAEIPPGVVNVIGGGGADVGEELVSNPMVDMVSFTGSVAVGRAVGAAAMQTIKRVQLELGGKSALIVLDDADRDLAVANAISGCMIHAGQGCGCTTRLLLPESLHDEIAAKVIEAARVTTVGDPRDPSVVVGPLIREQHRRRVESYVQAGIEEGAVLETGGRRPPDLPKGFFLEPTVFTGVRNDMRIAQEEIFGPVLSVIRYRDDDDAVRIANNSAYGLAGAVASTDRDRAMAVARRIRTGHVQLGVGIPNFNAGWGGYKQSGVGREWRAGLEEYTEVKTINWPG